MNVNKEEIIDLFKLRPSGNKGWYEAQESCPFCGKEKHLAVIFSKEISSFICQRCGEKGTIWKLLKEVGRLDLIDISYRNVDIDKSLVSDLNKEEKIEYNLEVPNKSLPIGFNRIFSDEYLEKRNFSREHFKIYNIGVSFQSGWKSYLIFLIVENGEVKGYVGRSKKSKEEIDRVNEKRVKEGKRKYLRWRNSSDTPFEKLLFGIDEIKIGVTTTVIVVEGITSKGNIDSRLQLFYIDHIKCVASFGKFLSLYQALKLYQRGIKNLIFLYDPDAVKEIKEYSCEYLDLFNVEVGILPDNKDPGDLNFDEVVNIMSNLIGPVEVNLYTLHEKIF